MNPLGGGPSRADRFVMWARVVTSVGYEKDISGLCLVIAPNVHERALKEPPPPPFFYYLTYLTISEKSPELKQQLSKFHDNFVPLLARNWL